MISDRRHWCITGATRGLGRQLSKAFAAQGANLLLVARHSSDLVRLQQELKNQSNEIDIFTGDLSDPIEVAALAERLRHEAFAGIINNAAIQGPIGPLASNDWAAWQATLQVNLLTPTVFAQALIEGWQRMGQAGSILNISGGGATGCRPNFSAYAAAKTALVRLTEIIAAELVGSEICAYAIAPGAMPTDMLQEVLKSEAAGGEEAKKARQVLATDASGVMERVVELCLFLAEQPRPNLSGRLLSAQWDDWRTFSEQNLDPDWFCLRRVVPPQKSS